MSPEMSCRRCSTSTARSSGWTRDSHDSWIFSTSPGLRSNRLPQARVDVRRAAADRPVRKPEFGRIGRRHHALCLSRCPPLGLDAICHVDGGAEQPLRTGRASPGADPPDRTIVTDDAILLIEDPIATHDSGDAGRHRIPLFRVDQVDEAGPVGRLDRREPVQPARFARDPDSATRNVDLPEAGSWPRSPPVPAVPRSSASRRTLASGAGRWSSSRRAAEAAARRGQGSRTRYAPSASPACG